MDGSQTEELAIGDYRNSHAIAGKLPPRLTLLRRLASANIAFIEALSSTTFLDLIWIGRHKASDLERERWMFGDMQLDPADYREV